MSNRSKIKVPALRTHQDMEEAVRQITELKTFIIKTNALMDQRITEIRKEYQGQLAEAEKDIANLMEQTREWAEANPSFFGARKSAELVHGFVGYRTGTPKLKTLTGWTFDRVLEKLKAMGNSFIRVKEEVDNESIIAAREELGETGLKAIGLKVVQEETFFVEPKISEVEKRETAKATA